MTPKIEQLQEELTKHPIYKQLNSIDDIKTFMSFHVYAVWDFMSLLKSLQRKITCVDHPWRESKYSPELVRLINEIVLGEESDLDPEGNPSSHFTLYLKAMEEVGADTGPIKSIMYEMDFSFIEAPIAEMINFHLETAKYASVHEVASSFFYGREKLIPHIFDSLVSAIEKEKRSCPTLLYYLKRHIEIDGDEHGPMAARCLEALLDSDQKREEAENMAIKSLEQRKKLWDFISAQLCK